MRIRALTCHDGQRSPSIAVSPALTPRDRQCAVLTRPRLPARPWRHPMGSIVPGYPTAEPLPITPRSDGARK
jgi:hypothetical protein